MTDKPLRIDVLTAFPAVLTAPLEASILGIALKRGVYSAHVHDLREWARDKHRSIDDYPYGGGPGMVLRPEPVFDAVRAILPMDSRPPRVVIMSPRGTRFDQKTAERYSRMERILLVCGRYEGFDERVYSLADEVVSVGDYVLTGGEIPALCVIDATVRLLPGALGDEDSATLESFTTGLLEHPQFTRPSVFEGMQVPEVLLSGDHARIERWRREQAVLMTVRHRPDLIETTQMSDTDRAVVEDFQKRSDLK